jgi:hypothetical protein
MMNENLKAILHFVFTNEIIVPWEKYAYNTNGHAPGAMVPNTEIGQLQNR